MNSAVINNITFYIGDKTRFGIIEEFIEVGGKILMRSNFPYGTWSILLPVEQQIVQNPMLYAANFRAL